MRRRNVPGDDTARVENRERNVREKIRHLRRGTCAMGINGINNNYIILYVFRTFYIRSRLSARSCRSAAAECQTVCKSEKNILHHRDVVSRDRHMDAWTIFAEWASGRTRAAACSTGLGQRVSCT